MVMALLGQIGEGLHQETRLVQFTKDSRGQQQQNIVYCSRYGAS